MRRWNRVRKRRKEIKNTCSPGLLSPLQEVSVLARAKLIDIRSKMQVGGIRAFMENVVTVGDGCVCFNEGYQYS